jgi:murein DD-endopeptidase MepM/ murein hydrolase activator NlpD
MSTENNHPLITNPHTQDTESSIANSNPKRPEQINPANNRWMAIWKILHQQNLTTILFRLGTHFLLFIFIMAVIWFVPQFLQDFAIEMPIGSSYAASIPTPTQPYTPPSLPEYLGNNLEPVINRITTLHTSFPSRSRFEVSIYRVKPGDTLFGIAEKFGLKPETLLWGNQMILADNPHNLRPDQELNILPVDGTYYRWQAGDGLNGVAKFFNVKPEDIVSWPGNQIDASSVGDFSRPNIEAGKWLVVPGGTRAFVTWSAPDIPRDNPSVAKVLGPGACESIPEGGIGSGAFIWPANNHFLSGYDWSPSTNHAGIDIDGETGDPIYSVDTGVIVYAGWNNWGYGNVVVISHGNGWQTLYAHLNAINVACGQSIIQGSIIAAMGETGNASGSHLHFEMMYNGTKVNPWDYLP